MKDNRNQFIIINMLVMLLFFIIFISRCNSKRFSNNYDLYSINLSCKKTNCKIDNNDIYVNDENGNYYYQNKLQIFNEILFPGISGSYYFRVNNDSGFNIKYQLFFNELFDYKINMKYRLKKNNDYIVGNKDNWVDVEKLNIIDNQLIENNYDNYLLEWMWNDSNDELDNMASSDNKYALNINFSVDLDNE